MTQNLCSHVQLPNWDHHHGIAQRFEVSYWEASHSTKSTLEVTTTEAVLENLKKGTEYNFQVRTSNDQYTGDYSDAATATTAITRRSCLYIHSSIG